MEPEVQVRAEMPIKAIRALWRAVCELAKQPTEHTADSNATHFGGILSGGSRIFSQVYLRELLRAVTGGEGPAGYVGGEMEGVGLLAACEKSEPIWLIVKGISDFADDQRHGEVEFHRPEACRNAVRLVLAALKRAEQIIAG